MSDEWQIRRRQKQTRSQPVNNQPNDLNVHDKDQRYSRTTTNKNPKTKREKERAVNSSSMAKAFVLYALKKIK